jgi:hypothetical protein
MTDIFVKNFFSDKTVSKKIEHGKSCMLKFSSCAKAVCKNFAFVKRPYFKKGTPPEIPRKAVGSRAHHILQFSEFLVLGSKLKTNRVNR